MLEGVNASIMGTSPVSESDLSHFQKQVKMMVEISMDSGDGKGRVNV